MAIEASGDKMREIEFRGKRPDNGEWVYGRGYLADNGTIGYPASIYSDKHGEWRKICGETLGQYTGLKDKNGKKIFEGDIMGQLFHDYDENTEIVYKHGVLCAKPISKEKYRPLNAFDCCGWLPVTDPSYNFEVIGNIHDNPDLLGAVNG